MGPADECLDFCIAERNSCKEQCSSSLCNSECNHYFEFCVDSCPCRKNCPSGCSDCVSEFCRCSDPQNDPDYIECEERIIEISFWFKPLLFLTSDFKELLRSYQQFMPFELSKWRRCLCSSVLERVSRKYATLPLSIRMPRRMPVSRVFMSELDYIFTWHSDSNNNVNFNGRNRYTSSYFKHV